MGSTDVGFGEPGGTIPGSSNHMISQTYSGWIDLFGWGTGNNPTEISIDQHAFSDWGNNNIFNGGGNNWFTLTKDEWGYIFNTRSTSSGIRYAKAIINGINGVILLPDNWSSSNYSLSNFNTFDASYSPNYISQNDWTIKLEANGAVFLPAAGRRGGKNVDFVGSNGYYWTVTYRNSDSAYNVYFYDSCLNPENYMGRIYGLSVRLVCFPPH